MKEDYQKGKIVNINSYKSPRDKKIEEEFKSLSNHLTKPYEEKPQTKKEQIPDGRVISLDGKVIEMGNKERIKITRAIIERSKSF